jgi:hypothetical protein
MGSRVKGIAREEKESLTERARWQCSASDTLSGPTPFLTRARDHPCLGTHRLPHARAMAGSTIKRQRKLGVRAEDGSVITFPRKPRVAELPRGWQHFGPAQKVEHLLNMSLDRAAEVLTWGPVADLDAHRRHIWLQVWRVVFMIGTKALFDGKLRRDAGLERDRERILEELAPELCIGRPDV